MQSKRYTLYNNSQNVFSNPTKNIQFEQETNKSVIQDGYVLKENE